jgi:hypothetical protein
MVSFKPVLTRADATAVRNYVIHRANEDTKHPGPPNVSTEPERR